MGLSSIPEMAGETWEAQASGTQDDLLSVDFFDPLAGAAGGRSGTILLTTDGGVTWTRVNPQQFDPPLAPLTHPNEFNAVNVGGGGQIWAVGFNRLWYATEDGGATWQGQEGLLPAAVTELHAIEGVIPFQVYGLAFSEGAGGHILELSFGNVDVSAD